MRRIIQRPFLDQVVRVLQPFKLASRDRFFLCLEARDPAFQLESAWQFLESLAPRGLWEVPR